MRGANDAKKKRELVHGLHEDIWDHEVIVPIAEDKLDLGTCDEDSTPRSMQRSERLIVTVLGE